MPDILTLALESSCDETSAAVLRNGKEVLSNVIASQIDIHVKYGGVVPEVASRCHMENVTGVMTEALEKAGVKAEDIDVCAVTCGPGLVGALLVGVAAMKAFAFGLNKPFVGVHHIEGHILANHIEHEIEFPYITLVVSGGHTHLVLVEGFGRYKVLGRTRDDAAGEAYDKTARILDLGYPGGPKIDKLAKEGDPHAIHFPMAQLGDSYDFSFSGLKSAVINYEHNLRQKGLPVPKADIAASFQEAVVSVLEDKLFRAAKAYGVKTVTLSGGVAANTALRGRLSSRAEQEGIRFCCPSFVYCTDNAAMIGVAAHHRYLAGKTNDLYLNAFATLELEEF